MGRCCKFREEAIKEGGNDRWKPFPAIRVDWSEMEPSSGWSKCILRGRLVAFTAKKQRGMVMKGRKRKRKKKRRETAKRKEGKLPMEVDVAGGCGWRRS